MESTDKQSNLTTLRRIRPATTDDAAACAAIYAPYVTGSAITFETEPPSVETMAARIAAASETHAWLVLEQDDEVRGYAYAGVYNPRAAYRWSCEISVYLDLDHRQSGGGRALYDELLPLLRQRGYRRVIAGVDAAEPGKRPAARALRL